MLFRSVLREVCRELPHEDVLYVADSGHAPYGDKPAAAIEARAVAIARFLIDRHVKAIVVACNTASAAAIDVLKAELPVPVIDVVEPGAKALVLATESGRAGVIGTVGTIGSGAYVRAVEAVSAAVAKPVTLTSAACPGFVEFVERGQTSGDGVSHERSLARLPGCKAAGRREAHCKGHRRVTREEGRIAGVLLKSLCARGQSVHEWTGSCDRALDDIREPSINEPRLSNDQAPVGQPTAPTVQSCEGHCRNGHHAIEEGVADLRST